MCKVWNFFLYFFLFYYMCHISLCCADSSRSSDLHLRFADEPLYQFYAESVVKVSEHLGDYIVPMYTSFSVLFVCVGYGFLFIKFLTASGGDIFNERTVQELCTRKVIFFFVPCLANHQRIIDGLFD